MASHVGRDEVCGSDTLRTVRAERPKKETGARRCHTLARLGNDQAGSAALRWAAKGRAAVIALPMDAATMQPMASH